MSLEPKNNSLLKSYLMYAGVLLFAIAIIVKIIIVQTKDSDELIKLAEKKEYRVRDLYASRMKSHTNAP